MTQGSAYWLAALRQLVNPGGASPRPKALYYLEITDFGYIITSFFPACENVNVTAGWGTLTNGWGNFLWGQ